MVELASVLGVFVQSYIETEKWFDGLNETGIGNGKFIAQIDEAAILVEKAQLHAVNSKLLDFKIAWMLLEQVEKLHIQIRHESTFRCIIEGKVLTLDEEISRNPEFQESLLNLIGLGRQYLYQL